MADVFSSREKGEERKFSADAELEFKVEARHARLMGQWVGEKIGMTAEQGEAYGRELAIVNLEEPGFDDVIRRVMADLKAKGTTSVTETDVRRQAGRLKIEAERQVMEG